MSRKAIPVEHQIIALFSGLSDEGKRIVMFGLEAMMFTPVTPRKKQEPVKKGKTTEPVCGTCNLPEDASGHDLRYLSSHPFAPSVGKRSSQKGADKVSEEMANAATIGG